jgi:hypothetical protein
MVYRKLAISASKTLYDYTFYLTDSILQNATFDGDLGKLRG